MKTGIMTFLVLVLVFVLYVLFETRVVKENKVAFASEKVTEPIRITQITDFHGNGGINLNKVSEMIKKHNPHMIFLTGDICDCNRDEELPVATALIKTIAPLCKNIYFVHGNHEEGERNTLAFERVLKENGVRILYNESAIQVVGETLVNIIGIRYSDDNYTKALTGVDKTGLNLVLSHSPKKIRHQLIGDEDFVFSGHLHGGQVRLPIIGAILAPSEGFFPKYSKGLYRFGKTVMHIDSGLGNTFLDLRTFNRVQLSNITIDKHQ